MNKDVILVLRADDTWLWESVVRTRVCPEGSATPYNEAPMLAIPGRDDPVPQER